MFGIVNIYVREDKIPCWHALYLLILFVQILLHFKYIIYNTLTNEN